ncbi:MAG: SDR family oxidoreductase [Pseudomonadota bacterium]|nr:SDR family oxidoreductase [Pseudomonadota bacterium]
MSRLQDKVVVILGASDERSMGAATARRFAREGAKLVLAARNVDGVRAIAEPLGALAVACDVTREEDLARLADTAVSQFGSLHAAINYSGVNSASPIAEITRETLQEACDVHFIGATLFLKQMAARMADGGSLITTSSLTALLAPPGLAAYAGTKKGVDQVVRIAAVEYGARGIRVNAIAPGFTESGMTAGYFDYPSIPRAFLKEVLLGRLTTVEDIANAALWLASDEAFITGQVLDITAGQSLRRTPTQEEMMSA